MSRLHVAQERAATAEAIRELTLDASERVRRALRASARLPADAGAPLVRQLEELSRATAAAYGGAGILLRTLRRELEELQEETQRIEDEALAAELAREEAEEAREDAPW